MTHAEICPVCRGSGQLNPLGQNGSTAAPQSQDCHGCDGKGWVEVGSDDPVVMPILPPVPPIVRDWLGYIIWSTC